MSASLALRLAPSAVPAGVRTEPVPAAADSAVARAWLARELARAVVGFRTVLLRYADGAADLVLVTDPEHGVADLASAVLAGVVAAPPPDLAAPPAGPGPEVAVPAWGLGDRLAAGHRRLADGPDLPAGPVLVAALALVLGQRDGAAPPEGSVGEFLAAAHEIGPLAGIVTGTVPAAPPGTRVVGYRPVLAPPYPLTVEVVDGTPAVWELSPRHLAPEVAALLARQVGTAHAALLAADPGSPVAAVPLLSTVDRDRVVALGTGAALDTRPERIDARVAARAAEHPGSIAVRCGEDRLTYRDLLGLADGVAAGLRAAGVPAGARVGVCLERSVELVVTLLGVLRAGCAYVPLDPRHPADRLAWTVADAGLHLVLGRDADLPGLVGPDRLPTARAADDPPPDPTGTPADPTGGAGDPAYVIYTSGSTGTPKGVVVPHRAVAALLDATRDRFGLGPQDRWTFFHSAAFDFSVWELWGCLTTGGELVVVPYWVSRSPDELAALVAAAGVTVLSQTPSAFGQLAAVDEREPLAHLPRLVVFGGEPLDTRPLLDWYDRHPEPDCTLVNLYGITETTVHVTAEPLDRHAALTGSRSVGRPLAGWSAHVLDPAGRLLPPGVPGEIHVGGAGMATGYLDRPELTAARFVPDPYGPGTLYRSGDRGRLLPDGRLEHLGRLDDQVKLRGHRIEPGEIRARLLDAPGVGAAAVVLRETPGDAAGARLDGYVVFGAAGGDPGEVRRHAARFLPAYMVPTTVTELPALPLTPNGKIDTARLPAPRGTSSPGAEVAADPVGAAWEAVFGVRVGDGDNFFDLGGNSLLAVRLVAALRSRGLPAVTLPDLYRNPTVGALGALLRGPA